ncbi:metalloregulator ArsR/SmtB family transcription factor [Candidatus Saccharibacteria bacterium]|nr:metalloregulator ArsR/SmtB family transcription factor [Candidatus Saccharibacteria bacterium]
MYQKLFSFQEEVFKVLANQKRLEIIQLLSGRELSVSQMVEMLGLTQSNLSQHLSLLRKTKVVTSRRDGQTIYYQLSDQRMSDALDMIKDVLIDRRDITAEEYELLFSGEVTYPIVKDVVCGMRISQSKAGDHSLHHGKNYFFCASGCKQIFDANTKKYMKKETIHG